MSKEKLISNISHKIYFILKIIEYILYVAFVIYTMFVFHTPGYYHFNILLIIILLFFLIVAIKIKKYIQNKEKVQYKNDLIEHKFACTYRKRYYNKFYFVLLILLLIISMFFIFTKIEEQTDKKINKEFVESLECLFDESLNSNDSYIIIYKKLCPVIPNYTKNRIINISNFIETIKEFVQVLQTTDAENYNELDLECYKNKIEKINIEENYKVKYLNMVLPYIYIVLFLFSYTELKKYFRHRSICL